MALNAPTLPVALATSGPVAATSLSATSASFTPAANALLIAAVSANNPVSGQDASVTVTGGSLTWTRRPRKNKNASSTGGVGTDGGAEIWTAVAPASPSAMTVNAVLTNTGQTGSTWDLKLQIIQQTDNSGSTPLVGTAAAAFNAAGLPSVAVSVSTGSYVFAVVDDWADKTTAASYGAGQTSLVDGSNADFAWHFWRTTSTTSAGTQTMNMTAPTAQNYNVVALEVQAASAPTTYPQRNLMIPATAVMRAATR